MEDQLEADKSLYSKGYKTDPHVNNQVALGVNSEEKEHIQAQIHPGEWVVRAKDWSLESWVLHKEEEPLGWLEDCRD